LDGSKISFGNLLFLNPVMSVSDSSDPGLEENSPIVSALFRIVDEKSGKNVA